MAVHTYNFGVLDPRNISEAGEHNDALLGESTLGVEVSVPSLAQRCGLGNIDPQHSDNSQQAAVENSLVHPLPPPGSTIVTIRPDLDSVASMAILELRSQGGIMLSPEFAADVIERIADIAQRDRFDRGAWPGPREIPTKENPWSDAATSSNPSGIAGLAAAISDFKVPLEDRVETMKEYLIAGTIPTNYQDKVMNERMQLIDALANGEISVETTSVADVDVAIVHSHHRAATSIGYMHAPVVIAVNDEFRFQGGQPHRKATICQFDSSHVDMTVVKAELNAIEPGVGGSPTIIGTRQGESSNISVEQMLDAIEKGRAARMPVL